MCIRDRAEVVVDTTKAVAVASGDRTGLRCSCEEMGAVILVTVNRWIAAVSNRSCSACTLMHLAEITYR